MAEQSEEKPKIKAKDIRRFEKIANQMNDLLEEIATYCPEVNMYLEDSGNWHLMTGPDHDRRTGKPRQDRSVARLDVWRSGGGGW